MPTDIDWKNYETFCDLVRKIEGGNERVYIPHELGQWFEKAALEESIFSEGEATSIYGILLAHGYEGYQIDISGPQEK